MLILSGLVFLGIFTVAALVIAAISAGGADEAKKVAARLSSLTLIRGDAADDLVNIRKRESLSSFPVFNRLLARLDLGRKLRDVLAQANMTWTPGRLLSMGAFSSLIPAYLVHLRANSAILAAIVGLVFGIAPLLYVLRRRRKRFDQFEQGLPGALDLMVSGLRSGYSLVAALGLVAKEAAQPIGPEFRICFDEQNYGLDLRTALENLISRVPLQDTRMIVTAILIQKETGGNLAEVLEKCGHVIRERFRLKKEIMVRTAQGRLTGWILSALPLVLGFMLYLISPENISLLWTRPMGQKMLYAGSSMTVLGALIIRKIVRIRV